MYLQPNVCATRFSPAALPRLQDDFSEFAEVDDLYQSLPLDRMDALESLEAVPAVPVSVLVKEKAAVAAATGLSLPKATAHTVRVWLEFHPDGLTHQRSIQWRSVHQWRSFHHWPLPANQVLVLPCRI